MVTLLSMTTVVIVITLIPIHADLASLSKKKKIWFKRERKEKSLPLLVEIFKTVIQIMP